MSLAIWKEELKKRKKYPKVKGRVFAQPKNAVVNWINDQAEEFETSASKIVSAILEAAYLEDMQVKK